MYKYSLFIVLLFSVYLASSQNIIYVDQNASGTGNGSSWANAFQNLQDAINSSTAGDEIWVAVGTYKPSEDENGLQNPTDPRTKTFHLKEGVSVYGGFTGNESQRPADPLANPSILSGEIGTTALTDNCYNVIHNESIKNGVTRIEGFYVERGYKTNISGANNRGAGLYDRSSKVEYVRLVFRDNHAKYGGAVVTRISSSTFNYCEFRNNTAETGGGAFMDQGEDVKILNCLFENNSVTSGSGGGYFGLDAAVYIAHSIFRNNQSSSNGGGLMLASSNLNNPIYLNELYDVVFEGNNAQSGAGAYFQVRPTHMTNAIFRENNSTGTGGALVLNGGIILSNILIHDNQGGGLNISSNVFYNRHEVYNATITQNGTAGEVIYQGNTAVTFYNSIIDSSAQSISSDSLKFDHCLLPGSMPGGVWDTQLGTDLGGNIDNDPIFFSETNKDYRLWKCSPGVDQGDNSKLYRDWADTDNDNDTSENTAIDLFNNSRILSNIIDVGAFEYNNSNFVVSDSLTAYATAAADSIKWIDCTTKQVLDTGLSFNHQGDTTINYFLIVYKNGCSDTSECLKPGIINIGEPEPIPIDVTALVELYPNPVQDILTLRVKTNRYKAGAFYNLSGIKVKSFALNGPGEQPLSLRELPTGVYLLRLFGKTSTDVYHARVVKK